MELGKNKKKNFPTPALHSELFVLPGSGLPDRYKLQPPLPAAIITGLLCDSISCITFA